MHISIIGSADLNVAADKFEVMVNTAESIITAFNLPWDQITLVSGGAAWADHVAVMVSLRHNTKLKLFLPCEWIPHDDSGNYADTHVRDWRVNPGYLANLYHMKFSVALKRDTLQDIETARRNGALIDVSPGFHKRNLKVAKSDFLIAFTSSHTNEPPPKGGTRHTWNACKVPKVHVSLYDL